MPRAARQFRPGHARPKWNGPRPSAAKRGYDRRWRKYRRWFLLGNPLCVRCKAEATDVDHIIEVNGQGDPLFWDTSNHQALCKRCHFKKTMSGR